jgi:hypothetical protein
MSILASQCRAARALIDMDQAGLARRAVVPPPRSRLRERKLELLSSCMTDKVWPARPGSVSVTSNSIAEVVRRPIAASQRSIIGT